MNYNERECLIQGLKLTQNPVQEDINKTEQYFNKARTSWTFLESLFKITMSNDLDFKIKKSAVLVLWNNFKKSLQNKNQIYELDLIRENIIDAITYYLENETIRKQLEEILKDMVLIYYPKEWPKLLTIIIQKMKSAQSFKQIYGALKGIHGIFKAFKLTIDEQRAPLNYLMERIFPYLENLVIKGFQNVKEDFLLIAHVVLKIFHSAIYLSFEKYLTSKTLKVWLVILKQSWECQFGIQKLKPAQNWNEMFDLNKHPIFKLKKQAISIMTRITQMLANKKNKYLDLFNFYVKILPALLDSGLTYLYQIITTQNQTTYTLKCVNEVYRILFYSIQIHYNHHEIMNDILLKKILYDITIHHFQITSFEEELYNGDQNQYIYSDKNRRHDPVLKVKQNAAEILTLLIKFDLNFVKEYLNFAENAIQGFNIRSQQQCDDRFKEGVLFGLEQSIEYIKDDLNKEMDNLIEKLILPVLKSENLFLRARGCSIISHLTDCEIRNMNMLFEVCQEICKSMQMKNILLQIKSVKALSVLITIQETQNLLRNDLKTIIETLFYLMKVINLEDLLTCLKTIVCEFQEDIQPFAKELISNLVQKFWDIVETNDLISDSEEFGEQSELIDALESSLVTISQILWCDLDQQFYIESQKWLIDIIAFILNSKVASMHLFDYFLELLNIYLYKLQVYDDQIYFLFPIVCYTIVGSPKNKQLLPNLPILSSSQKQILSIDFVNNKYHCGQFEKYLGILGNFVQKGFQVVFTATDFFGKRFLEYIFDIVDFLTTKALEENVNLDIIYAIWILSFLFENNFELVKKNQFFILEEIIKYYDDYLNKTKNNGVKSIIYQKFFQLFYLDCETILKILIKLDIYNKILYGLFGNLQLFESYEEKEIVLLAMIGLFKLPPEQFPKIIPLSSLVKETLSVLIFLVEKYDQRENFQEEAIEIKSSEYSDDDESDDQSWNEQECLEEKDFDYDDPIEKLQPVLELQATFRFIEKQYPSYFFQILNELSDSEQKRLLDAFKFFEIKAK